MHITRDISDNFLYQRRQRIYRELSGIVSGDVLEIGDHYAEGIDRMYPTTRSYSIVSRHACTIDPSRYANVEFYRSGYPPLPPESCRYDFIVCFYVLVNSRDDFEVVRELHRLLRPGGKVIVISPNPAMTLARNPWHKREYSIHELGNLLGYRLNDLVRLGIFGNEKAMSYYEKLREQVSRILGGDRLGIHRWMPQRLMRIPYRVYERISRRRLLIAERTLTASLSPDDYYLAEADNRCFDWVFIASR